MPCLCTTTVPLCCLFTWAWMATSSESSFDNVCRSTWFPPELRVSSTFTHTYKAMAVKVEHSSHDHVVVMACLILPIIALICVIIRIWTRFFVSHSLGYDDCWWHFSSYLKMNWRFPDTSVVTLVPSAWYPGPLLSDQISHSFCAFRTASSREFVSCSTGRTAWYAEQLAATTKDVTNLPEYIKASFFLWHSVRCLSTRPLCSGHKSRIWAIWPASLATNYPFYSFTFVYLASTIPFATSHGWPSSLSLDIYAATSSRSSLAAHRQTNTGTLATPVIASTTPKPG